jgi:hypothetical protein
LGFEVVDRLGSSNSWSQSFVVVVTCRRQSGHFSFSHKNKGIRENEYGNYDNLRNKTLNCVRLWWMTSAVFWSEPKASKGEREYIWEQFGVQ